MNSNIEDKTIKPPTGRVYYDEFEMHASDLYEKFAKEKSPPELLLEASEQIAKSSNPEAGKISILYKAWYLREKGLKEKNNDKSRRYLLKSMTEFKKIVPADDVILKRIELEFLRRKFEGAKKRPELKMFLMLVMKRH